MQQTDIFSMGPNSCWGQTAVWVTPLWQYHQCITGLSLSNSKENHICYLYLIFLSAEQSRGFRQYKKDKKKEAPVHFLTIELACTYGGSGSSSSDLSATSAACSASCDTSSGAALTGVVATLEEAGVEDIGVLSAVSACLTES